MIDLKPIEEELAAIRCQLLDALEMAISCIGKAQRQGPTIESIYDVPETDLYPYEGETFLLEHDKKVFRPPRKGERFLKSRHDACMTSPTGFNWHEESPRLILRPLKRIVFEEVGERRPRKGDFVAHPEGTMYLIYCDTTGAPNTVYRRIEE